MPNDYIPGPDGDFDSFFRQFRDRVNSNPTEFGLNTTDKNEVNSAFTDWGNKYPAHIAQQDAAKKATQDKHFSRKSAEAIIRAKMQKAKASGISDGGIAELGGTVPKKTRTPVHAPTTFPVGEIDTRDRLRHIIHFRDALSASRRKPAGVFGCEIFMRIGSIDADSNPIDIRELRNYIKIATDTRSPYTYDFAATDANKTALYILRWISTRGEVGPISETIEATIQG